MFAVRFEVLRVVLLSTGSLLGCDYINGQVGPYFYYVVPLSLGSRGHYNPLKHWQPFAQLHTAMSQKT